MGCSSILTGCLQCPFWRLCYLPLVLQGSPSSICENGGLRTVQAPLPGVPGVFPEGSPSSICENGGLRTVRAPLPGVPGVFLEGKAQDGDGLVGDRVEQALDDLIAEATSLVVVDVHHLRTGQQRMMRATTVMKMKTRCCCW